MGERRCCAAPRGVPGDRLGGALGSAVATRVAIAGRGARRWPALARDRTAFGLDPPPCTASTAPAPRALGERESLDLLRHAGLAVTPAVAVRDADAPSKRRDRSVGHAVVLKIDAPDLPHKSDLGLVRLGLRGDDAVRAAAEELLGRARRHGIDARGLLVEPMAEPGVELIVGARRDASFGPLVMVGLGGVLAEVLDDVAIRLAPVTRRCRARDAGRAARRRAPRRGSRRTPGVDRDAVAELIVGCRRVRGRAAGHPRDRPQPGHRHGRRSGRGRRPRRRRGRRDGLTNRSCRTTRDRLGRPADARPAREAQALNGRARRRARRRRSMPPRPTPTSG